VAIGRRFHIAVSGRSDKTFATFEVARRFLEGVPSLDFWPQFELVQHFRSTQCLKRELRRQSNYFHNRVLLRVLGHHEGILHVFRVKL